MIYTTPGCPDCAKVKRFLEQHDVAYREKDVTADPKHLEEMQRVAGVRIAPVTVVGGRAFYGTFERQRDGLEAALRAKGLMKKPNGH